MFLRSASGMICCIEVPANLRSALQCDADPFCHFQSWQVEQVIDLDHQGLAGRLDVVYVAFLAFIQICSALKDIAETKDAVQGVRNS